MEDVNHTRVTEFILLAVTDLPELKAILFGVILAFYLINMVGNLSITMVVINDHQLHTPMYFLLANLSILDMCISSITVPKMLVNLLVEKKTISFVGCVTQLYLFHFLGSTEAMLLTAMSYDRYIAICHPLRYVVIMSGSVCFMLASSSWIFGFLYSLFHTILTSRLPFCASNRVSHFFCDIKPLLKLACTNTHINEQLVFIISGSAAVTTFLLILVSYICIGSHLLKIKSSRDRCKAFSTCASHLIMVLFYVGTAMCTYLRPPTKDSLDQDRVGSILFTVVTPTLNPIVYTLRNKEVKRSLRKYICGSAV